MAADDGGSLTVRTVRRRRVRTVGIAILGAMVASPLAAFATAQRFNDVADGSAHAAAIEWLAERGVTTGCGNGQNFCPSDGVTRAQMATFLRRLAGADPNVGPSVDALTLQGYGPEDLLLAGPEGPTGPQGEAGPSGEAGPIGPVGPQGEVGPQGLQGMQGLIGPQGEAGPQGETGPAGPQGVQGEVGPIGPVGPQGEAGPVGPQGLQGMQGLIGPQGATGPQGETGATGPQGETGATGLQGETGSQGAQGPQGATGLQGLPGETGATGAQGPAGEDGRSAFELAQDGGYEGTLAAWLASLQGEQGPQGPEGPAGTMGILSVVRRTSVTPVAAGAGATLQVGCEAGELRVGGGVYAQDNPFDVVVHASYPGEGNWTALATNQSATATSIVVFVLCLGQA